MNVNYFLKKAIKYLDLDSHNAITMKNDFRNGFADEWRESFVGTPLEEDFEEIVDKLRKKDDLK